MINIVKAESNKVIRAGAIDIPLVDFAIPRKSTLIDLINEKNTPIEAARELMRLQQAVLDSLPENNTGKDKVTMTAEQSELVKEKVNKLREATLKLLDYDFLAAGGTGPNKIHAFIHTVKGLVKANKLNNVEVEGVVIGSLGNDSLGPIVQQYVDASGYRMHDPSKKTETSRASVVIMPENGNVVEENGKLKFIENPTLEKNRTIYKHHFQQPEYFKDVEYLKAQTKDLDVVFMEASLVTSLKPRELVDLAKHIKDSGKMLIFSPPTDQALFVKDKKVIKENAQAFYDVAKIADGVFTNEKELIWYSGNYKFNDRIKDPSDNVFTKALDKLKKFIGDHKNDGQFSTVTYGPLGAQSFKTGSRISAPADDIPPEKIANNIGAGDGFTGAMAAYVAFKKLVEGVSINGNGPKALNLLNEGMRIGAKVAGNIIQHVAAQIDGNIISNAVSGLVNHFKSLIPNSDVQLQAANQVDPKTKQL